MPPISWSPRCFIAGIAQWCPLLTQMPAVSSRSFATWWGSMLSMLNRKDTINVLGVTVALEPVNG